MTSAQIVFGRSWFYGVVRGVTVPCPTPIWGLEGQKEIFLAGPQALAYR